MEEVEPEATQEIPDTDQGDEDASERTEAATGAVKTAQEDGAKSPHTVSSTDEAKEAEETSEETVKETIEAVDAQEVVNLDEGNSVIAVELPATRTPPVELPATPPVELPATPPVDDPPVALSAADEPQVPVLFDDDTASEDGGESGGAGRLHLHY